MRVKRSISMLNHVKFTTKIYWPLRKAVQRPTSPLWTAPGQPSRWYLIRLGLAGYPVWVFQICRVPDNSISGSVRGFVEWTETSPQPVWWDWTRIAVLCISRTSHSASECPWGRKIGQKWRLSRYADEFEHMHWFHGPTCKPLHFPRFNTIILLSSSDLSTIFYFWNKQY